MSHPNGSNASRWYSLGWDPRGPALVLRIHPEFARQAKAIPDDSHFIVGLREKFGLRGFSGDLNGQFGFEGVFTREDPEDGFVRFKVPIPVLNNDVGPCKYSGDGSDTPHEECTDCMGTGRKWVFNDHLAHAIVASFHAFLEVIGSLTLDTDHPEPQLMQVFTSLGDGCYDLRGMFSPFLRGYLSTLPIGMRIQEVERAMYVAYSQIFGSPKPYVPDHFRASVDHAEGWLNISCPGLDFSRITPVRDSFSRSLAFIRGYDFVSDGVTTPAHQLVLCAGLGALDDLARPFWHTWRAATRDAIAKAVTEFA